MRLDFYTKLNRVLDQMVSLQYIFNYCSHDGVVPIRPFTDDGKNLFGILFCQT